jgi:hypothetical protein
LAQTPDVGKVMNVLGTHDRMLNRTDDHMRRSSARFLWEVSRIESHGAT